MPLILLTANNVILYYHNQKRTILSVPKVVVPHSIILSSQKEKVPK
jgi:hypothetical protein